MVTKQAESHDVKQKLPIGIHLVCGWPLLLVALGGAVGGALGGIAYSINIAIYRAKLPLYAKIALNIIVGISAIGIWYTIANMVNKYI